VFLPQSETPSFAPVQHNWRDRKTKYFGLNNRKRSTNLLLPMYHISTYLRIWVLTCYTYLPTYL
jgi:hypothetical protein